MEKIRAFIAIELTAAVHAEFERVIKLLGSSSHTVRWMAPQNIHLTLKFLGDIDLSGLNRLKDSLLEECLRHESFEIRVEGLGAFPNNRRPRVIWIGVQAPPNLAALQKGIETVLLMQGYPREERPFSPHLTLGRVSQHAGPDDIDQLAGLLGKTRVGHLGTNYVKSVQLFQSDLHPTGPIYTHLFEAFLK
jgi:2'-5' RNA ligase